MTIYVTVEGKFNEASKTPRYVLVRSSLLKKGETNLCLSNLPVLKSYHRPWSVHQWKTACKPRHHKIPVTPKLIKGTAAIFEFNLSSMKLNWKRRNNSLELLHVIAGSSNRPVFIVVVVWRSNFSMIKLTRRQIQEHFCNKKRWLTEAFRGKFIYLLTISTRRCKECSAMFREAG